MLFPLSSRGGLEKGDKSIRPSPLQPQASIFCSVQDLDCQVWMTSSWYFLSFVDGSRGHPEMWLICHGGLKWKILIQWKVKMQACHSLPPH